MGAGSVETRARSRGELKRYSVRWVSDAAGNTNGNRIAVPRGRLIQAKFVPGAGGVQPSNAYDVQILDADGVDVLGGAGADRSNAAGSFKQWDPPLIHDGQPLDVVVSNAGNAKQGVVTLWLDR